jgi:hypothetical protein
VREEGRALGTRIKQRHLRRPLHRRAQRRVRAAKGEQQANLRRRGALLRARPDHGQGATARREGQSHECQESRARHGREYRTPARRPQQARPRIFVLISRIFWCIPPVMLDDIPALRTATRQGAQAPSGGVGPELLRRSILLC